MYSVNDPKSPRIISIPTIFGEYMITAVLQNFGREGGSPAKWNMRIVLGPCDSNGNPNARSYPGKGLIRDPAGYTSTAKPSIIVNTHGHMPKVYEPLVPDPDFPVNEQPLPYAWSKLSVKLALPRVADLCNAGGKATAVRMAVTNHWNTVDNVSPVFEGSDYVYKTWRGSIPRHALMVFIWQLLCRMSLAESTPFDGGSNG